VAEETKICEAGQVWAKPLRDGESCGLLRVLQVFPKDGRMIVDFATIEYLPLNRTVFTVPDSIGWNRSVWDTVQVPDPPAFLLLKAL
jgi:hypothetical protein